MPTQPLPFHGAQGDQKGAGCSQSPTTCPSLGCRAGRGPDLFESHSGPCNTWSVGSPCRSASTMPQEWDVKLKKKKKFLGFSRWLSQRAGETHAWDMMLHLCALLRLGWGWGEAGAILAGKGSLWPHWCCWRCWWVCPKECPAGSVQSVF